MVGLVFWPPGPLALLAPWPSWPPGLLAPWPPGPLASWPPWPPGPLALLAPLASWPTWLPGLLPTVPACGSQFLFSFMPPWLMTKYYADITGEARLWVRAFLTNPSAQIRGARTYPQINTPV